MSLFYWIVLTGLFGSGVCYLPTVSNEDIQEAVRYVQNDVDKLTEKMKALKDTMTSDNYAMQKQISDENSKLQTEMLQLSNQLSELQRKTSSALTDLKDELNKKNSTIMYLVAGCLACAALCLIIGIIVVILLILVLKKSKGPKAGGGNMANENPGGGAFRPISPQSFNAGGAGGKDATKEGSGSFMRRKSSVPTY